VTTGPANVDSRAVIGEVPVDERLHYGTWIRTKKIFIFWALTAVFLSTTVFVIFTPWFLLLLLPASVSAYIAVIVTLTYWRFSPRGGGYQNKIHDLLLSYKTKSGDTADIGCGNGNLIIKVARADRNSAHIGLDYWGKSWEYSMRQCQINARIEEVDNVQFLKRSAARTGLDSEHYSYVVSCLTFHEVRDQPDKAKVVAEALRVLKPGGTYIFFDLFDDKRYYPSLKDILKTIELAQCDITENALLSELIPLAFPLDDKNALRYARLLIGRKSST
jgi:SAM-dependent methyltransferase